MEKNIWEEKMVWVVTVWLKEVDDEGEPLNCSCASEEYYAYTPEEAEEMKARLLSGNDEYYGDLVEDVWIRVEDVWIIDSQSINKGKENTQPVKVNNLEHQRDSKER